MPLKWPNSAARTSAFSSDGFKSPVMAESARFISKRFLRPALEQISTFDERLHLAVHHAALQHPETAVRVDIVQAIRTEDLHDVFNPRRHQVGALHFVVLDIDQTNSQANSWIEIGQHRQFLIASACELQ